MFVLTDEGHEVNLDHVATARCVSRDDGYGTKGFLRLDDVNGHVLGHLGANVELEDLSGPVVPAPAGYSLLVYVEAFDAHEDFIDAYPVIAWRVGVYGSVPITGAMVHPTRLSNPQGVEFPDGRVSYGDDEYPTRAAWLVEARRECKAQRERRERAAAKAAAPKAAA